MQDAFLDYLNDLDMDVSSSDQNNVLLCQAILSVLQRRMVYPELTRYALETLANLDLSQDEDADGDDLASAIMLAKQMHKTPVQIQKGKKDKRAVKGANDNMASLVKLLTQHIRDRRASERLEVIRQNLDYLCQMFNLGTAEARVLFAAYTCQNHSPYDLFADGLLMRSKSLVPALACLLGMNEAEASQICKSDSALAQSGLVSFDRSSRIFTSAVSTYSAIDRVIQDAHGSAEALRKALLGPCVTSPLAVEDFPHLSNGLGTLVRVLSGAIRHKAKGVNILLHGRPGTGKTQLAMVLAAAAGGNLMPIGEKDSDDKEPNRDERLGALLMKQKMLGADAAGVCMFDEMEDIFSRPDTFRSSMPGSKVFLNRLLETNPHPVIWIANDIETIPVWLRRRMVFSLQVDHPPAEVQERILTRILQDRGLTLAQGDITELARMDGIAPGVARNAIYAAQLAGGGIAEVRAGLDGLSRAVSGGPLVFRKVEGAAAFDPDLSVADLDLTALADGLIGAQDRAFSLCLYGAPGTGKSAYARHLAARMGMKVLQKRASDLFGAFVGETEQAIAAAFAEARDKEAFLIFDEADSLLMDRATATHRFEMSQVSEMLTWMESHPLPFACTTNLMDRLDAASLRRFTFKVKFDYLRPRQSKACFQRLFNMEPPLGLGRLVQVAPADFQVVAKKAKVLGFLTDPERLLDLLRQECAAKGEVANPIGFRMATAGEMLKPRVA